MNLNQTTNTLEPIKTIQVPFPVQSLCFVGNNDTTSIGGKDDHDDDNSSCSSSDSELNLRCSNLLLNNNSNNTKVVKGNLETSLTLSNRKLLTCRQTDGTVHLWDLAKQQISCTVSTNRIGPGLAVRRVGSQSTSSTRDKFLCHTRDPLGIVSIHSLGRDDCPIVRQFETYSQTFCAAAPCWGNPYLFALPSRQESSVTVVDTREKLPISVLPFQSHGMVTSLAMSTSSTTTTMAAESSGRPILACGMESGTIFFHDLASGRMSSTTKGECRLSREPVLTMDLAPSTSLSADSVIAVAGLAGDAAEMSALPPDEQGPVALVKASIANANDGGKAEDTNVKGGEGHDETEIGPAWNVRIRTRLSTCSINKESSGGRPGVSICRFQPGDARLFAVGGWDKRVRLFDRSTGAPKAILRGHSSSVDCLDWAGDADESGLLATSVVAEKRIHIWQCYGKVNQ